jgi:flagellar motor switch protein FliM
MSAKKDAYSLDLENPFDFHNFSQLDTHLPILDIINERLVRQFRVYLSNHLRVICTFNHETYNSTFGGWVEKNKNENCYFIVRFAKLHAAALIKFNRRLAYGLVDMLTGGLGEKDEIEDTKEFTQIDLTLLKEIAEMLINDLNVAWEPIENIQAQYVRTEINSEYIGIVPPKSKIRIVKHKVNTNVDLGEFEIIYPYSTIFPMRDKLFKNT